MCQPLLPAKVTYVQIHPGLVNPDPKSSISVAPASPVWGEVCLIKYSYPSTETSYSLLEELPELGHDMLCTSWQFPCRHEDQLGSQWTVELLNHGDNMFFMLRIAFIGDSCPGLLVHVMDWMFVFPQNSSVVTLTPSVALLGDGAAKEVVKGKWGHKGTALIP